MGVSARGCLSSACIMSTTTWCRTSRSAPEPPDSTDDEMSENAGMSVADATLSAKPRCLVPLTRPGNPPRRPPSCSNPFCSSTSRPPGAYNDQTMSQSPPVEAEQPHIVALVLQSRKALRQGEELCLRANAVSSASAQTTVDVLALDAQVRWLSEAVLDQLKVSGGF